MTRNSVKRISMQDSASLPFKTLAQKYSPMQDVTIVLFTEEKIFTVSTAKLRRMTNCAHIHQPGRKT